MSQEDIFEQNPEFSPVNENPAVRAKIIGVGGAGLSLVDGLRLDNFKGVEHLVIDVDAGPLPIPLPIARCRSVAHLPVVWVRVENFPSPARQWSRKKMPLPNNLTE